MCISVHIHIYVCIPALFRAPFSFEPAASCSFPDLTFRLRNSRFFDKECCTAVWRVVAPERSHVTYVNESCHVFTYMNGSCHAYEWVMSVFDKCGSTAVQRVLLPQISYVTYMNESCHGCRGNIYMYIFDKEGSTNVQRVVLPEMIYVTYMNEAWDIYEWVMSEMWMSIFFSPTRIVLLKDECCCRKRVMWRIRMSHVKYLNESCHVSEWVMSRVWMSHVTYINKSCHVYEWVMSRIWMSNVIYTWRVLPQRSGVPMCMKESCHVYGWIMSHMCGGHVSCVWEPPWYESCHLGHSVFHWKGYTPEVHRIEKLRFLAISGYKFKWKIRSNLNLYGGIWIVDLVDSRGAALSAESVK